MAILKGIFWLTAAVCLIVPTVQAVSTNVATPPMVCVGAGICVAPTPCAGLGQYTSNGQDFFLDTQTGVYAETGLDGSVIVYAGYSDLCW